MTGESFLGKVRIYDETSPIHVAEVSL